MRLGAKWFLWFASIGTYVMLLGGVFYYNLFKWTFDEKLKQDMLELVRLKSPELIKGLLKNPKVISFEYEYDVIEWLRSDKRITDILYLNPDGTVRWYKQAQYIGMGFDEFEKTLGGMPTDALGSAVNSQSPKVKLVPKQPFYEIAIPLKSRSNIIGILDIQVSREGSEIIIKSAMRKYIMGAIGVLILLGIPIYLFLNHYVIGPLVLLRDSIDNISTKSFEMKFAARADEIGELAESLSTFLAKVRQELEQVNERERQRQSYEQAWWQIVLGTIVTSGNKALVVDEDNSVLFANFELNRSESQQKLHLLDVVESQQQDVLRLVSMAMDTPQQVVEGAASFKGVPMKVRVVQIQSEGNLKRTLIFFEQTLA